MIKDYIIIDNVLDDPEELILMAKGISFYSKEKENLEGITTKAMRLDRFFAGSNWRGFRSDFIHEINQRIFQENFDQIMKKMMSSFDESSYVYHYRVQSHLHFAPAMIEYHDGWWHKDPGCLFAGVVYLNKNPEPDSGTILRLDDGEIIAENVFNRLVLYRSNIEHRPQKCFGDNVNNSRLTLTMFFNEFAIKAAE